MYATPARAEPHAAQAAELEYEAALERRRQEVEADRLRRELAAVEAASARACAADAPSPPGSAPQAGRLVCSGCVVLRCLYGWKKVSWQPGERAAGG